MVTLLQMFTVPDTPATSTSFVIINRDWCLQGAAHGAKVHFKAIRPGHFKAVQLPHATFVQVNQQT